MPRDLVTLSEYKEIGYAFFKEPARLVQIRERIMPNTPRTVDDLIKAAVNTWNDPTITDLEAIGMILFLGHLDNT